LALLNVGWQSGIFGTFHLPRQLIACRCDVFDHRVTVNWCRELAVNFAEKVCRDFFTILTAILSSSPIRNVTSRSTAHRSRPRRSASSTFRRPAGTAVAGVWSIDGALFNQLAAVYMYVLVQLNIAPEPSTPHPHVVWRHIRPAHTRRLARKEGS